MKIRKVHRFGGEKWRKGGRDRRFQDDSAGRKRRKRRRRGRRRRGLIKVRGGEVEP
jgi:hypothetical protein